MAAGFWNKVWSGIKKGAQKVANFAKNVGKKIITKGVDIAKNVVDNGVVRTVAGFIPGASNVLNGASAGLAGVQKIRDRII